MYVLDILERIRKKLKHYYRKYYHIIIEPLKMQKYSLRINIVKIFSLEEINIKIFLPRKDQDISEKIRI